MNICPIPSPKEAFEHHYDTLLKCIGRKLLECGGHYPVVVDTTHASSVVVLSVKSKVESLGWKCIYTASVGHSTRIEIKPNAA